MNWYVKTFLLKMAHLFLKHSIQRSIRNTNRAEHVFQMSVLASCFLFLQVNRDLKIWSDFKRSLEISIYIYFILLIQNNYPYFAASLMKNRSICIHVLVSVCTARIQVDNRPTGNFFIHSMLLGSFYFTVKISNKKKSWPKRLKQHPVWLWQDSQQRRRPCESRRT